MEKKCLNVYVLIFNPTAGNGLARKVQQELALELEKRGIAFTFMQTMHPGHATELAAKAAQDENVEAVIAIGGDGTAFEVASGLKGTGKPFGIIPAGTGNDFIKTTKTVKKPVEALNAILSGTPRKADVATVNGRMFLNVCGCGFDVTTLEYMTEAKKHFKGILPYLIGLVRGIRHYRPVHVHVETNGEVIDQDALICAVANGRFFGGGIEICPAASIDDGMLDIVLLDHKPRWMIPFYLPLLLFGRVLKFPFTRHIRTQHVRIDSPGMKLQIDGEIFLLDSADIELLPGELMLYW